MQQTIFMDNAKEAVEKLQKVYSLEGSLKEIEQLASCSSELSPGEVLRLSQAARQVADYAKALSRFIANEAG